MCVINLYKDFPNRNVVHIIILEISCGDCVANVSHCDSVSCDKITLLLAPHAIHCSPQLAVLIEHYGSTTWEYVQPL